MKNTDKMSALFIKLIPEHQNYTLGVMRTLIYAQNIDEKTFSSSENKNKNDNKSI